MSAHSISTGLKVNKKIALKMAGVEFLKRTRTTTILLSTYDKLVIEIAYKGSRDAESIAKGMQIVRVLDRPKED